MLLFGEKLPYITDRDSMDKAEIHGSVSVIIHSYLFPYGIPVVFRAVVWLL